MENIKYFFRSKEDDFKFKKYGPLHFSIVMMFLVVSYVIISDNFNLFKSNISFLKVLATIILIDQVILYLWQFGSKKFSLDLSLPLYHCRISVFFLILSIYTDVRFYKVMTMFWGILGSVFALSYPDLYSYSFPHYTNFQFFIVHLILGWVVVDFIFVENFNLSINDLWNVLVFTNLFNILLIFVNKSLKSKFPKVNYGYLMSMPGGKPLFNSQYLHMFLIVFLFNIGTILLFFLINNIR